MFDQITVAHEAHEAPEGALQVSYTEWEDRGAAVIVEKFQQAGCPILEAPDAYSVVRVVELAVMRTEPGATIYFWLQD